MLCNVSIPVLYLALLQAAYVYAVITEPQKAQLTENLRSTGVKLLFILFSIDRARSRQTGP